MYTSICIHTHNTHANIYLIYIIITYSFAVQNPLFFATPSLFLNVKLVAQRPPMVSLAWEGYTKTPLKTASKTYLTFGYGPG